MTKENETPKGLKFNVNDGGAGQKQPEPETKKIKKVEEEKENATKNTASGTRSKD